MNANLIRPNDAGVKFTFPLFDTWRIEYENVNPSVKINHIPIDREETKKFTESTVEFDTTHAPLSEND